MNYMILMSKVWRGKRIARCMRAMVIIFITSHFSLLTSQAQSVREAFKAMPDSLVPYLTANNRLDLMDFMDAKMKAVIDNALGGQTEMTFLADDSLSISMSDALTIELKTQQADTVTVVDFKRTYTTREGERQTVLTRHDARSWQELCPPTVIESTLTRFDQKVIPPSDTPLTPSTP